MAAITKENIFCRIQKFFKMRKRKVTLGLNTLLNEINLTYVTERDYGYKLGPIMNAAGRLHDNGAIDVFKVLKTHLDVDDAKYTETLIHLQEQVKQLIKNNPAEPGP